VYLLSTRAVDRKEVPELDKLPIPEPLAGVTQLQFLTIRGAPLLVITTRAGLMIWDVCETLLMSKSNVELGGPDDGTAPVARRGNSCLVNRSTAAHLTVCILQSSMLQVHTTFAASGAQKGASILV